MNKRTGIILLTCVVLLQGCKDYKYDCLADCVDRLGNGKYQIVESANSYSISGKAYIIADGESKGTAVGGINDWMECGDFAYAVYLTRDAYRPVRDPDRPVFIVIDLSTNKLTLYEFLRRVPQRHQSISQYRYKKSLSSKYK